jgi:hypothetical protein
MKNVEVCLLESDEVAESITAYQLRKFSFFLPLHVDFRIEFGAGFPGREAKDRAYEPLQAIFEHGPALSECIITTSRCVIGS